jgi:hypothetical protein
MPFNSIYLNAIKTVPSCQLSQFLKNKNISFLETRKNRTQVYFRVAIDKILESTTILGTNMHAITHGKLQAIQE